MIDHLLSDMSIEDVKALYFNDKYIQPQTESLHRIDTRYGRVYVDADMVYYGSQTAIIKRYHPMSPHLLKWWATLGYEEAARQMLEKSRYGTFQHIIFADLFLGHDIDISRIGLITRIMKYAEHENFSIDDIDMNEWIKKCKQDTIGHIQWMQDYEVEPIAIEISLKSMWKYAGTIDLVAWLTWKDKRVLSLIDWKSNRIEFYEDNEIQLQAGTDLWNENYPDMPIDMIFNYGCKDFRLPIGKTVTPYRFADQTQSENLWKWNLYLSQYHREYEYFKPSISSEIKDIIVNAKTNINECLVEVDPLKAFEEAVNAGKNTKGNETDKDTDNREDKNGNNK